MTRKTPEPFHVERKAEPSPYYENRNTRTDQRHRWIHRPGADGRAVCDRLYHLVKKLPKSFGVKGYPKAVVKRMYSDYLRTRSFEEVGRVYGRSANAVRCLFATRGLTIFKRADELSATGPAFPIPQSGPSQLPASLVWKMWEDYCKPLSLSAVERKYGKKRGSLRNIFERRGLKVRVVCKRPAYDPKTGRILKLPAGTPAQIAAMIEKLNCVKVPFELKREWRQWCWEKRGAFLKRVWAKFRTAKDRPTTPFSSNVEPFDYCSPRAHEIAGLANAGRGSHARIQIRLRSEGVIWRGRLFYWIHNKSEKGCGYAEGIQWSKVYGRPLLHRLIWEEENKRKVPLTHTVIHKDGNKNNLDPSNLALRSRKECARENMSNWHFKVARERTAAA